MNDIETLKRQIDQQFSSLKREIELLKRQIDVLTRWKEERERRQLHLPLDPASIQVLNEAFKGSSFDKIVVQSLFLKTGVSNNPLVDGQVVYHDSSDVIKTRLNGTVKTFTTS